MRYEYNGGICTIAAQNYSLVIDTEKAIAGVVIGGAQFAKLDLRSAVNKLGGDLQPITDSEPEKPEFSGISEMPGQIVLVWKAKSALWDKQYSLICTPSRFRYRVGISGEGRVDSVNYFSGDLSAMAHGSEYEFSEGFYPCAPWQPEDSYYFSPEKKYSRWNVLMIPPMFCYAFGCKGASGRLALGLVAERGEHNFGRFDYNPCRDRMDTAFYLSTDQNGHTRVDGSWTAPEIIGCGARDEFDAMQSYSDYYFASGIAGTKKPGPVPRFWHGPIACGWIEQIVEGHRTGKDPVGFASEKFYEDYVRRLSEHELHPRVLIIDDKWQEKYATAEPDPAKWNDLKAFIARRRAEGIHTLLWFKLWDREGFDDSLCVKADNGAMRIDPSNPEAAERIRANVKRLLSPEGLDADGFKLDFAFFNPEGRGFTTYSGKYGTELLYDYMKLIYDAAKEVKPDALINCSPCHPYFANICDQARLHDYSFRRRDNLEDLETRARLFGIANPGTLIDTDNAGYSSRRDTMRWLLNQPKVGVPDIYSIRGVREDFLTDDDLEAIAEVWREYSARIDRMY